MSQGDVKTPYVDETCIGCSACVAICGEVFDLDEEGKAFARDWMDTSNADGIDDAIAACPVNAIHYKD